MATVGDAAIKLYLSDRLYEQGLSKADITEQKKKWECNKYLKEISDRMQLSHYAHDDTGRFRDDTSEHEKMPDPGHNFYLEAVVGAVFKDGGYEKLTEWLKEKKFFEEE